MTDAVYISASATDEMNHRRWVQMLQDIELDIVGFATQTDGRWLSFPDEIGRSACWLLIFRSSRIQNMYDRLRDIISRNPQAEVIWAIIRPETITHESVQGSQRVESAGSTEAVGTADGGSARGDQGPQGGGDSVLGDHRIEKDPEAIQMPECKRISITVEYEDGRVIYHEMREPSEVQVLNESGTEITARVIRGKHAPTASIRWFGELTDFRKISEKGSDR
jgi:hypothetical protein